MPRKATEPGNESTLLAARDLLRAAKTADELRTAQAVLLPLEHGFSLAQAGEAIGRSVSWVTHERRRFIASGGMPQKAPWGGRRRQWVSAEEENEIVKQAIVNTVNWGDVSLMSDIARQLEARFPGVVISRSTAHSILMRVAKRIIPGLKHKHDFRQLQRGLATHWMKQGMTRSVRWGWDDVLKAFKTLS